MKSFGVFMVVLSWSSFSQSYTLHGGNIKRYTNNRGGNVIEPMISSNPYSSYQSPTSYQQQLPSTYYYDDSYPRPQQQYPSASYSPISSRVSEDYYNYNNRNPNYYIPPRQQQQQQQQQQIVQQDYQTPPLYGILTYRGEYQPKPYYFAQPTFTSDDQIETTNPLDYLHEEILQENERERLINNEAFMQNLAAYNKVDSLKERSQQLQQMEDMYKLGNEDSDEYSFQDIPSDWYDRTEIIVDPDTYENLRNNFDMTQDYSDDQMVKELRGLQKQKSKNKSLQQHQQQHQQQHREQIWQPTASDDYEEEDDDTWINWSHKRSIQPKKDYGFVDKVQIKQQQQQNKNKLPTKGEMTTKMPSATTSTVATSTSMENSKLLTKLHKNGGQKEVVLFRPATPVRKPFSDSVLMIGDDANSNKVEQQTTPPIYRTIKQIIDMEQNFSHVSFK